jgi:hypothetical protein
MARRRVEDPGVSQSGSPTAPPSPTTKSSVKFSKELPWDKLDPGALGSDVMKRATRDLGGTRTPPHK